MHINPIRSEQDHAAALKRIESLMESEKDVDINELEVLSTLVDVYEQKHHAISPPDPIEAIRFRMEQAGLTPRDLVPVLGTPSRVSEVLSGRRALTLQMARSLHEHLGIPADSLLERPAGQVAPESQPDWKRFPIHEMIRAGWLPSVRRPKQNANLLLKSFVESAGGPAALPEPLYRKTDNPRQNVKSDAYALRAWCYKLIALASCAQLPRKYTNSSITAEFAQNLAKLSTNLEGPKLAVDYLARHGIHLICLPHLSKTYLDGAAFRAPNGAPLIGLTLRHDRVDNFWFCLFHELAHVALHLSVSPKQAFFDDLELGASSGSNESDADRWAQEMLIPPDAWKSSGVSKRPSAYAVIEFAQQLGINPAIVAGRVRRERHNYRLFASLIGSGQVRKHFFEPVRRTAHGKRRRTPVRA